MMAEKCLVPGASDSRQSNKFVEWPGPHSRRQLFAAAMAASRVGSQLCVGVLCVAIF